jgi:hypothetical protein
MVAYGVGRRASMAAYGVGGTTSKGAHGPARRASLALPRSASLGVAHDGGAQAGGGDGTGSAPPAIAADDILSTHGSAVWQPAPSSGHPSTAAFMSTGTEGDAENFALVTGSSSFGCTLAMVR